MQPRLARNVNDKMIAGVCSGLGDYFSIDPVIVRIIFVLVTLTSGVGVPVYVVLWVVMPRASSRPSGTPPPALTANGQNFSDEMARLGQQLGEEATRLGQQISQEASQLGRDVFGRGTQQQGQRVADPRTLTQQPPPPSQYRYDPYTGQPMVEDPSVTGQTVNLTLGGQEQPIAYPSPTTPPTGFTAPPRGRNWSTLGTILIGIGALIFLEQIGINMTLVFPILLIAAGIILLRRHR